MRKIPQSPLDTQTISPLEPEVTLIHAIFRQAMADLKPYAEPYAHASALRFWRGDAGDLAWFCDVLSLDMPRVQRHVAQRYPEVLAPRQLQR
jgi:hypothetical protein